MPFNVNDLYNDIVADLGDATRTLTDFTHDLSFDLSSLGFDLKILETVMLPGIRDKETLYFRTYVLIGGASRDDEDEIDDILTTLLSQSKFKEIKEAEDPSFTGKGMIICYQLPSYEMKY